MVRRWPCILLTAGLLAGCSSTTTSASSTSDNETLPADPTNTTAYNPSTVISVSTSAMTSTSASAPAESCSSAAPATIIPGRGLDTFSTLVLGPPALTFDVEATPSAICSGDDVTFELTAHNTGPDPATVAPRLVITEIYPHVVVGTLDAITIPAGASASQTASLRFPLLPPGAYSVFVSNGSTTDGATVTVLPGPAGAPIRIPNWPQENGEQAGIYAQLVYDPTTGCVFDSLGRMIVWPPGWTPSQDPLGVRRPDGTVIEIGDQITGGGGYHHTLDLEILGGFDDYAAANTGDEILVIGELNPT